MPPGLATIIFTVFVMWLWRQDAKHRPQFSKAVWIPFAYFLVLCSRPPSWWLWFYFGIGVDSTDLEGNPLNRYFYLFLIFSAVIVLKRRGLGFSSIAKHNWSFALFYVCLLATVFWAEFPVATLKRWIKEVGAIPIMLVLLTETNPIGALKMVATRVAFIVFPYSVLALKYFPDVGRIYSHSGGMQVVGIADQKNSLGEDIAICGLILIWQLLDYYQSGERRWGRAPVLQWLITLSIGLWLLGQCNSKTSMLALALGSTLLLVTRIPFFVPRRKLIVILCIAAVPGFIALDRVFDIYKPLLEMLGRNVTLTNRTEIWDAIRRQPANPVIGCGYMNYWDWIGHLEMNGDLVQLKTAHNGYLEVYLDAGILGIVFMVLMLVHVGFNHASAYIRGSPAGTVGFALFCMLLLVNKSESLIARKSPLWSMFLIFTVGAVLLLKWEREQANIQMIQEEVGEPATTST